MFPYTETNVSTGSVSGIKVFVGSDVVKGRTVQVGTSADQHRQSFRQRLQHFATGLPGRDLGFSVKNRNLVQQIRRYLVFKAVVQDLGQFWVSLAAILFSF